MRRQHIIEVSLVITRKLSVMQKHLNLKETFLANMSIFMPDKRWGGQEGRDEE